MLALSGCAQSRLIMSSALALAGGWICTIIWWRFMSATDMSWGFSVVDVFLAAYFFKLSRTHRFPRPLFAVHVASVLYLLASTLTGFEFFWVALVVNRFFEAAILYVMGCAAYRIAGRRRREKKGALSSAPL